MTCLTWRLHQQRELTTISWKSKNKKIKKIRHHAAINVSGESSTCLLRCSDCSNESINCTRREHQQQTHSSISSRTWDWWQVTINSLVSTISLAMVQHTGALNLQRRDASAIITWRHNSGTIEPKIGETRFTFKDARCSGASTICNEFGIWTAKGTFINNWYYADGRVATEDPKRFLPGI